WWNARLKKALPFHPILTMWISVEKALPTKGICPVMEGLHRCECRCSPFPLFAKNFTRKWGKKYRLSVSPETLKCFSRKT
ncbi:MAG: hypothetical protein II206_11650, partial [Bacteroidaceae bacterium]|nr:hypothetical protein [Bacteroidaceae bacterium]